MRTRAGGSVRRFSGPRTDPRRREGATQLFVNRLNRDRFSQADPAVGRSYRHPPRFVPGEHLGLAGGHYPAMSGARPGAAAKRSRNRRANDATQRCRSRFPLPDRRCAPAGSTRRRSRPGGRRWSSPHQPIRQSKQLRSWPASQVAAAAVGRRWRMCQLYSIVWAWPIHVCATSWWTRLVVGEAPARQHAHTPVP